MSCAEKDQQGLHKNAPMHVRCTSHFLNLEKKIKTPIFQTDKLRPHPLETAISERRCSAPRETPETMRQQPSKLSVTNRI